VRKTSPPPGFDPRTFQPVVSCYTDYAIPAHVLIGKQVHERINTLCDPRYGDAEKTLADNSRIVKVPVGGGGGRSMAGRLLI
jgi:hypothetical protein